MGDLDVMLANVSVNPETEELMESSKRIDLDWTRFICKPNAGKAPLADLKSKNLSARFKGNVRGRASLLRHQPIPKRQKLTFRTLILKLFSLMGNA